MFKSLHLWPPVFLSTASSIDATCFAETPANLNWSSFSLSWLSDTGPFLQGTLHIHVLSYPPVSVFSSSANRTVWSDNKESCQLWHIWCERERRAVSNNSLFTELLSFPIREWCFFISVLLFMIINSLYTYKSLIIRYSYCVLKIMPMSLLFTILGAWAIVSRYTVS